MPLAGFNKGKEAEKAFEMIILVSSLIEIMMQDGVASLPNQNVFRRYALLIYISLRINDRAQKDKECLPLVSSKPFIPCLTQAPFLTTWFCIPKTKPLDLPFLRLRLSSSPDPLLIPRSQFPSPTGNRKRRFQYRSPTRRPVDPLQRKPQTLLRILFLHPALPCRGGPTPPRLLAPHRRPPCPFRSPRAVRWQQRRRLPRACSPFPRGCERQMAGRRQKTVVPVAMRGGLAAAA